MRLLDIARLGWRICPLVLAVLEPVRFWLLAVVGKVVSENLLEKY